MPDDDESLTVSSMSQSPFHSRRSNAYQHQQTQKNPLTQAVMMGFTAEALSDAVKNAYEHHSTEKDMTTLGHDNT